MDTKSRVTRRDLVCGAVGGTVGLALGSVLTKEGGTDTYRIDSDTSSEGKPFAVPKDSHSQNRHQ